MLSERNTCTDEGGDRGEVVHPLERIHFYCVLAQERSLYRVMTERCSGSTQAAWWRSLRIPQAPLAGRRSGNYAGTASPQAWGHRRRRTERAAPQTSAPSRRISDSASSSSSAAGETTCSSSARASSLLPPVTHELVSKYFLYSWQKPKPNFPSLLRMEV